jgi:ABC-type multidrug transport system fused ATPase/permease subunit
MRRVSTFQTEEPVRERLTIRELYDAGLIRRFGIFTLPRKSYFFILFLLTISVTGIELTLPYIFKTAIDACLEPDPLLTSRAPLLRAFLEGTRETILGKLALLFLGLIALRYLLGFGNVMLMTWLSQKIMYAIRMTVFKHLQKLSVSYFDTTPLGRLVTRVTNDVQALNELFTNVFIYFFKDIFILGGILIILFELNAALTLVIFSVLPFILVATILFRVRARKAYRRVRTELAKLNAFVQEHVNGMEVIQLFARENYIARKFAKANKSYFDSTMRQMMIMAVFNPFIHFSSSFAAALVIWYGGGRYLQDALTIGTLYAFLEYVRMFFRPLSDLTEKYNIFQSAMAAAERLFQILDTPVGIPQPAESVYPSGTSCSIEFKDVSFSYIPGEKVLTDVSFTIEAGTSLAIVGPTGAGKSSIINLICRFYDVDSGTITYNGVDIQRLDKKWLRERIGLVLQDVFLFAGDIKRNIRLNNHSVDDAMIERITAEVHADSFIDKLPRGLATNLSERALNFSSGERQLLAFARALARDPDLLILDEATANIDTGTEEKIQDAVERLMKGRTSIVIAHRLSTIQKADRILVIDDGSVKEIGTHEELITLGGIYYDLFSLA